MINRKYQLWAVSKNGTKLSSEDFKTFVLDKIAQIYKGVSEFRCQVHVEETSRDFGVDPPPSHFFFFFTVTKLGNTKTNYPTVKLLDGFLRTDPEIKTYSLERISSF